MITDATKQQNSDVINLEFRPIVGGPQGITQRLSHFVDLILKPLCSSVKSFIKDDLDFFFFISFTRLSFTLF